MILFFYSQSFSSDKNRFTRNTKAWRLYNEVLTSFNKVKYKSERLLCKTEIKLLQAMDIVSNDHEELMVVVKKLSNEGRNPEFVDVLEPQKYYPNRLLLKIRRLIPPKPSAKASMLFDGKNSILEVTIANFGKSMMENNTISVSSIPWIPIPSKSIEKIKPHEHKSVKWIIQEKVTNHTIKIEFLEKYGFNVYPLEIINYN